MTYTHLTDREKFYIEWQYTAMSMRQIALALERNVSTISREIARCLNV
ncbi:MAG: helix-turn-helix domain-containing protein [Neisseriaceae bacterium]|nr:helix-turn-helix domain-containing protein [Neisseriaceae bacterium]